VGSRVVNGYLVNRLTGPEGWTGPETDGPVNRRIIHYLAIMARVQISVHEYSAAANFQADDGYTASVRRRRATAS